MIDGNFLLVTLSVQYQFLNSAATAMSRYVGDDSEKRCVDDVANWELGGVLWMLRLYRLVMTVWHGVARAARDAVMDLIGCHTFFFFGNPKQ